MVRATLVEVPGNGIREDGLDRRVPLPSFLHGQLLRLPSLQFHHGTSQRIACQNIGLCIMIIVISGIGRGFSPRTPEPTGIHAGHVAGEFRILLCITYRHLGLPRHEVPWVHLLPTKAHRGNDRWHFRRLELPAQILDQVGQMFFIYRLRHILVLMALEPDKAGDIEPLPLVAGNDSVDVLQGATHPLDHEVILQPTIFVSLFFPCLAT